MKGDYYLVKWNKELDYEWKIQLQYIWVIAQTDVEKGHKGINAFIVEKRNGRICCWN